MNGHDIKKTVYEKVKLLWKQKGIQLWHQLKLRNMFSYFHNQKHVKTSPNEALEILLLHLSLKNVQYS